MTKIEKISLIFVILGISLFFVRIHTYSSFLGSFLDLLWTTTFSILLYDKYKKTYFIIFPVLLGYCFEIFQLVCKFFNISWNVYYPGTPDLFDIFAYTLGGLFAFIIIKIVIKLENKNSVFFEKGDL